MNIQHSQQIQHIRHAQDYQRFARTPIRSGGHRRTVTVAAAAITAFVAASAFGGPARAAHPSDESASAQVSRSAASPAPSVSSPCFAVRTADRWPDDVGSAPRCTHTYGATDTASAITVTKTSREPAREPVRVTVDHINDMYAAQVREAAASEASTDGWSHHIGVVPQTAVTETDGWQHHIHYIPPPPVPEKTDPGHWSNCFYRFASYRAWQAAQVGMPRCDVFFGTDPSPFTFTANEPVEAMDSPCFMNPDHWNVRFEDGRPVCYSR